MVLAYRILVVAEGRPRAPRWLIGVPALIAWTCAIVFAGGWFVD